MIEVARKLAAAAADSGGTNNRVNPGEQVTVLLN